MSKLEELIEELCPEGVPFYTIDELCEIQNGYTPSKKIAEYWNNGDVPWFRMEDIRQNGKILNDAIRYVHHSGVKGNCFPANSIIFATTATIGEHALIRVPFLCNQQLTHIHIKNIKKSILDIKYLFYYSDIIDVMCKNNTKGGSTLPAVSLDKFKKFKIPIPPLPVQHEIVRILDTFTELMTELTEKLTAELMARKKQYEYYRDALLSVCENKVSLMDIEKKHCSGATPKKENQLFYENGNIPWLRTQEVVFNEIYETECLITDYAVRNTAVKWIPRNCVIVAISGASAGRCAINKIPLTTNQHCLNIEIDETKALYKYVFYCISNQYNELVEKKEGARGDLNASRILNLKIPLPTLRIQKQIVNVLDSFNNLTKNISERLPAEIEARQKQYEYYRDKLLTFKKLGD